MPDIVVEAGTVVAARPGDREVIRERDLTRHFLGDGERREPAPANGTPPAAKPEPKGQPAPSGRPAAPARPADARADAAFTFGEPGKDLQLDRAIDMLKSWQVFQALGAKRGAVAQQVGK